MRQGNWKAIEFFETQTVEIYDLSKDPGETKDLSQKWPDKLRELTASLHAWQEETGAPRPIAANPNYDPSVQPDRGKGKGGGGGAGKRTK
jgi:arylsulfatase A-like enzyme